MVSSTLHTTVVWRAHLDSQVHVHVGLRFDPSSIRRKDLSVSRGTCTCYRPLAGLLTPTNANTTCSSMGGHPRGLSRGTRRCADPDSKRHTTLPARYQSLETRHAGSTVSPRAEDVGHNPFA